MEITSLVTLHTEGVDWNLAFVCFNFWNVKVTLHTEGVDWNHWNFYIEAKIFCHPPHGGCGLKYALTSEWHWNSVGHPPHGGCGLKSWFCRCRQLSVLVTLHTEGVDWNFCCAVRTVLALSSPSTRRVWIEIGMVLIATYRKLRHPPHGGCGLKSHILFHTSKGDKVSPSTRRVWIEIHSSSCGFVETTSPSTRRVWIEMALSSKTHLKILSPSTRRVWIEINLYVEKFILDTVTLHTEGVDWNQIVESAAL